MKIQLAEGDIVKQKVWRTIGDALIEKHNRPKQVILTPTHMYVCRNSSLYQYMYIYRDRYIHSSIHLYRHIHKHTLHMHVHICSCMSMLAGHLAVRISSCLQDVFFTGAVGVGFKLLRTVAPWLRARCA